MKTVNKDSTNGLFTMSRKDSGELTHKAVENYLSMGRRMQSIYVCKLLYRSYRRVGAVLARTAGWFGAALGKICRRRIEVAADREIYF